MNVEDAYVEGQERIIWWNRITVCRTGGEFGWLVVDWRRRMKTRREMRFSFYSKCINKRDRCVTKVINARAHRVGLMGLTWG